MTGGNIAGLETAAGGGRYKERNNKNSKSKTL